MASVSSGAPDWPSLARALYPILDRYDYVLNDCQPSLGLLTVNGLACSDGVNRLG